MKYIWDYKDRQYVTIGDKRINVHACIFFAKKIPVTSVNIKDIIAVEAPIKCNTTDNLVKEILKINEITLEHPVLLLRDRIIDGNHRYIKALLLGKTHINAKVFDTLPRPTYSLIKEGNKT